jgi:ribosomal protein L11 methyltransferase
LAWLELTLRLQAEAFPRAEALLELAGAMSIAFSDAADTPILEPAPGTTPLWPAIVVRALFADGADPAAIVALVGPLAEAEPMLARVDDADIEARARSPIVPVQIGPRLTVVPAESLPDADDRALGLHMGLAFGTGSHPTTRLCLEWIERELEPGIDVLDYGSGSGILALAALRLGAAHATAIDTEPQALAATRRNAELNGLLDLVTIGSPEALPASGFDLVVANILARPLIELAETFAAHQPAGGRIVLSGVLDSQLPALRSRYAAWYQTFATRELAGWGLLTGVRRAV